MDVTQFSVLNLLDLPPIEREVLLWVTRNGPAGTGAVAAATGRDETEIERVLAGLIQEGRLHARDDGRVLVFDRAPGPVPQAFPWILEAAMEGQGRAPVRGLRFKVPHAIATWLDGDAVELLALTHWREEGTVPIQLLYPDDVGPTPKGNEHALHARLTGDRAPHVVRRLVDACNRA